MNLILPGILSNLFSHLYFCQQLLSFHQPLCMLSSLVNASTRIYERKSLEYFPSFPNFLILRYNFYLVTFLFLLHEMPY